MLDSGAYLKVFIGRYSAKLAGLEIKTVRASRINALGPATDRIISEIHYANTIIDMLLMKAGKEFQPQHEARY